MLINLLRAALMTPGPEGFWGLPLFLWGDPGIGKTHIIKAICRMLGLSLERLSPGERGEGQFGVVPVPGADGFLHYPAPAWAAKFEANPGLIFVDEANTAPPGSIQAALLGLVQLRVLGSHEFGPRVRTLAAANEVADAAGGWDLPVALANRFGHLDVEKPDATEWGISFLNRFSSIDGDTLDATAEEKRVMDAWDGADAMARGLVNGFITRKPDMLHKKPARGAKVKAWASPRSVTYAAHALAGAKIHGLSESETDELMGAFVGDAWVSEFVTWKVNADLPDPAAFLDGKAKFEHSPRRLDRTLAVLGACAALVAPKTAANRKARAGVLWQTIDHVMADAADIVVPAARVCINAGLVASVVPEAKPVLNRLDKVLLLSGVRRAAGA
jgi:MoxR-like ATPase